METISKTGLQATVVAAVAAVVVTWGMGKAFVDSTAVARWVDAAQVAGQVVASTAEAGSGPVKAAASSLLW
jgi:hypothetical protein